MPNSSGVYANSAAAINQQAATINNTPQLNAAGNYGTDPLTGAPILDKFAAQTKMANLSNPNSLDSQYLRTMPTMMMPNSGGSGGGGGRMGPPRPRNTTMRIGPRTAAEYSAENGGLSPQRTSALDAAYGRSDLQRPGQVPTLPRPPSPGMPMQQAFNPITAPGGGMGEGVGTEMGNMLQNAMPGMKPQMMAKGGTMKMGKKPYLVGEEGPELIMPRENGDGFVLPHDVTKQVLPMMRDVTPRAAGGVMESKGGTFRGFEGVSSSGQPAMGFASNIPTAMMTPNAMARVQGDKVFVDPVGGRYQVDPNQIGMPLMPDVVSGPFAEPGMPAPPREQMRGQIGQSVDSLMRMPGVRPTNQVTDQATGEVVPFNEMMNRVTQRGQAYGAEFLDRQARDRTQLDLAARNARAPIGTPTMIPGQGNDARIQSNVDRQMERLSRTPQGAMFLAEQQGQKDLIAEKMKAASTAVPVRDPATGEVRGYVTGTGASLPNMGQPAERQIRRQGMVEGTMYNFFDDGTAEPVALPGGDASKLMDFWDSGAGKVVKLPADIDPTQLPPGLTPLKRIGSKETASAPAASPSAAPVKVSSLEEAMKLSPGTQFMTPNGILKIR